MKHASPRQLKTDVLVIGGGLAGCWAAITAAQAGVKVVIAEKGYCGTSGVAASAGPGHWFIPPEGTLRQDAIARRLDMAQGLGDAYWMEAIIDRTFRTLPTIASHYRYTQDDNGKIRYHALRGPEYLRALRLKALESGVTILDHSPALRLLRHEDNSIAGATGVCLKSGQDQWMIRSGATILATGGCAFRSHLLGGSNNTGDGLLMAAEAGACFSGMEFSAFFTIVPATTTMARTMIYSFARYYDASGHELERPESPHDNRFLAAALKTGSIFCDLSRVPDDIRGQLPQISPNVPLTFQRLGIDPFTQKFPVSLVGEGTIRGVGGIRVTDRQAGCGIPGLYVAGDVASREPVTGAISGGGAVNAAWALSSGCIAAESAVAYIRKQQRSPKEHISYPEYKTVTQDYKAVEKAVQDEMLSPHKQYFRTASSLEKSAQTLDAAWQHLSAAPRHDTDVRAQLRNYELKALTAVSRWCTASAIARRESRGIHYRIDSKTIDTPTHILSGGLTNPWTRSVPVETFS